jgi:membrane-associated phospholipid phosphatase
LLAAAGVGASRVYLGVHWPADVIAGWLFADGWLHLVGTRTLGPKVSGPDLHAQVRARLRHNSVAR